jgi:cytochrome P450
LEQIARRQGDAVRLRVSGQPILLLSDPELIHEVLVTQQHKFRKGQVLERARALLGDGLLTSAADYHKRSRRLVQPAFHRERLSGYGRAMVECAASLCGRWVAGASFDVAPEMTRLTLAIIGQTLFSTQVESEADEIGTAMTDALGLFELLMLPFSGFLTKLPLPAMRRFHAARHRLDRTIYSLIAKRRASGEDQGDLLSMLLLTEDDGERMTDQQVRDEAMSLFVAGHETTANALTWAWYLLSQHPEAEARMHAELREVLGGRLPAFDDVPSLRYTGHVFAETLRLYPPAWAMGRKALEDVALGPYTLRAGWVALMSPWVVHRDSRWFPEPQVFRPERWEAQDPSRPKFAYFPFAGGARGCIGERFALMEGVLTLATIGQKWRLRLAEGHPVATKALFTLRPRHGMKMVVVAR